MRAGPKSSGAAGETSLGRAVAVTALAPIAGRLAEEREREERKEGRRRRLEEELAMLPALDLPEPPGAWTPWWRTSELGEVLLGIAIVGIPVVAVAIGVFALLFGPTAVAIVLGVLCGSAIVLARTVKATLDDLRRGRQVAEVRDGHAHAVKAFEDREAERAGIQARFDRGEQ